MQVAIALVFIGFATNVTSFEIKCVASAPLLRIPQTGGIYKRATKGVQQRYNKARCNQQVPDEPPLRDGHVGAGHRHTRRLGPRRPRPLVVMSPQPPPVGRHVERSSAAPPRAWRRPPQCVYVYVYVYVYV